jgi:hypothetical protein
MCSPSNIRSIGPVIAGCCSISIDDGGCED